METTMYITETQNNNRNSSKKFESESSEDVSIPSLIAAPNDPERSGSSSDDEKIVQGSVAVSAILQAEIPAAIKGPPRGRRYSVLDDLRAKRDSLLLRARRGSLFEDKSPSTGDSTKVEGKRRSSEENRRGSVFYVSEDLPEETVDRDGDYLEDSAPEVKDLKDPKGRRKSWHPLAKPPKVDRKRRKGVAVVPQVGSADGIYVRQKRPSWWNIFAPESSSR